MRTASEIFAKPAKQPSARKPAAKKPVAHSRRAARKPDRQTLELLEAIRSLKGLI